MAEKFISENTSKGISKLIELAFQGSFRKKDYKDYNPQFNMMPGGAILQPSLIRPPGM